MHMPSQTVRHIHFVGIGGIGMSGIAEVLINLGYSITGSDISENTNVLRLRSLGALINIGHSAQNIDKAQVVVVSSGIKNSDNPEIMEARHRCVPVIRRAEMLAELMRLKQSIAICGTHGKTTTTSLTAALFDAAGLDPTVVNGGIINAYGTNAYLGSGEWIIVEADESDGSFLKLPSTISVITNIDPDHMDFYANFEELRQSFITFIQQVPFYGLGVLCVDHPVVRSLITDIHDRRLMTYGFSEDANIRGINLRESPEGILFDVDVVSSHSISHQNASESVTILPRRIRDIFLPMMGRHNVQNALSSIAIAQELGIDDDAVRRAFATFKGVKRRFSRVGVSHDITIIDDYAHHPVEIQTVLQAGHQASNGAIIAVMQPHRYSRLHDLFEDFTKCFSYADKIIITPVYGAGESPIDGVSSITLAQGIMANGHNAVHTISEQSELAPLIAQLANPGDMVICLGAGSITHWAAALTDELNGLFVLKASANIRDANLVLEESFA